MTPKERAAMQQALGALEQLGYGMCYAAIDLREALGENNGTRNVDGNSEHSVTGSDGGSSVSVTSLAEQTEQSQFADAPLEPMAWMRPNGKVFKELEIAILGLEIGIKPIPLYAAPPRTKDHCNPLQDLTDDEILDVALSIEIEFSKDTDKFVQQLEDIEVFARAVIEKFKEKNK